MRRITILSIEDEPEVRDAISRDLAPFREAFRIEFAEDAADARELIAELTAGGDVVGVVLADHLLPGERGTDFLIDLNNDEATAPIRKVLLTGQAGHDDTIRAVNDASLDYYIAKPWSPDELQGVVRDQLTSYVLAQGEDPLPYVQILDGERLLDAIASRGLER